uniref:Centromere protein J C-terminal domain-containing protein n=1 Tax=Anopheles coluzzii TaxID=1518534 RepID=A0A8W7P2P0_ANOCL
MADSPRSILVRLEQLKQWQEEQQRVLLEKHLAQQQLLEREQQKMYEVLGLRQHSLDNAGDDGGGEESYAEDDSEPEYEETNLQAQLASERLQQQAASGRDDTTVFDSENEQPTAEQAQALQKTKNVPKKRFLKRGEGLRARFKVDPDKFKLENLPKYKFANHNRERSNRKGEPRQQQSDGVSSSASKASRALGSKQGKVEVKQPPVEKKLRNKSDQGIVLDINRVQDKKLISTRRMGGSLPTINAEATKQDAHTNETDQLLADRVKRFSVTDMIEKMVEKPPAKPNLPWKKRLLDPAVPPKVSKEQRDLNFFELLEKKVVGKNFSPNSSSILRFIAANESTANEETLTNDESMYESTGTGTALVRQEEVIVKDRLSPPPSRADLKEGDSDESDDDQAHVHFAEDGSKCSAGEDTDVTEHETYHRMQRITSSKISETDENNGNRFYAQHDSSDDDSDRPVNGNKSTEDEGDDDDDEDDYEAIGENSSSAQDSSAVQSSYFPKNPAVRKTLFNAVNLNEDAAVPRQGLVRKENPLTQCDLLDRTPEAAEMIKSMKREIVNADGSRDIWYPNGNLKKISADGLIIRMLYFNKDIKETNMTEGTTKYYYFETNTWHTTYLDGLEILEFPDGQTEHRFKDGSTEVHFPNGSIRTTNPNSADIAEEWKYPDGTTVIIRKNDDKEINLPNGQVEIHTKAHKRRIYPDGTVKFVYPDGSQESRYSNGRIRLKDKDGRLISDTGGGP